MIIYIGADHRGFALKENIKSYLAQSGYEVVDCGAEHLDEQDDYPLRASAVARKVSPDADQARGIVVCGSGVGASIVANKFPNIRCALCFSSDEAMVARTDDNANILALGADFINAETAKKIASVWLQTDFAGTERYVRRIEEIRQLEYELKNTH